MIRDCGRARAMRGMQVFGWANALGSVIALGLAAELAHAQSPAPDAGSSTEPSPPPSATAAPTTPSDEQPPPTAAEPSNEGEGPAAEEPATETLVSPESDVSVTAAGESAVAAPAANPEAGEMVVTAQRYEQDVQKAPVTVTAFGQRSMDQRGVSNLQDIGKFTPNLELHATNRPAGGGSAYAAYIRGIGTGDFQFPTDPGVGLYIDDVYVARTVGGLLSTDADIARIEVIKGPQGTLFGRNTIGGAFNIATSKPLLEGRPTGSGLVRFGTYGRHDFALNANSPIIPGAIGGKISLSTQHLDGYGRRILLDERTNDEERFVARAGLLFKPASRVEIRLDGDYSRQDQNPPNGQFLAFVPAGPTLDKIAKYNQFAAPALNPGLNLAKDAVYDARWLSPGRYENFALQPVHDRYDIGGGSVKVDVAVADWLSIKSISAIRVVDSAVRVDGDQTPYPLQSTNTQLDDTQLSEELQFSGRVWDERLQYLLGLYAFRESGRSSVDTQSFHGLFENEPMPIDADAGDTLTRFKLTATSLAVFTQETLEILSGLHLTLGARLNHDQKDYDYGVDFTQRNVPQVPQSTASASWNSFTPKIAIDYAPFEPMLIYASYSQGFKSGGFGPSNMGSNPTPKYDPERVTAYEVGVKTHWFEGRRLIANVTGFYNDYSDIQLTVQSRDPVTGANLRTTENAGTSHIKGFEAELAAKPFDGMTLNAGLGYVDAKFASLTADAVMSGFKVGDRLPQISDWSANAGAQYAFGTGVGELALRFDVSWKGDQYLTPADPSSHQKSVALYSARISFVPDALEELEVALYGINLTDEVYYVYRATLPPTGQTVGLAGPPRLIFATARYTF
ncbi:MAG TPA: TonB-dependent receptor [Polyangiales bacterium]|nr:TonB-dependent receptor [Polyangiales bacterium]